MEPSDETLAAQVQAGDNDQFGLLVQRYEDKMIRYGRKFLSDRIDIVDLVQDIFVRAYENINSFNAKYKFSSWLYRVAHNAFVNALREKSRRPILFFDIDTLLPHPIASETADGETVNKELQKMMETVLNKLDLRYREPLVLFYFEEMNYQEIAEVLRIPTSTVGIRLRRGREKLRILYNQEYE